MADETAAIEINLVYNKFELVSIFLIGMTLVPVLATWLLLGKSA
jgi:hypothetical protein